MRICPCAVLVRNWVVLFVCETACDHIKECVLGKFQTVSASVRGGGWVCVHQWDFRSSRARVRFVLCVCPVSSQTVEGELCSNVRDPLQQPMGQTFPLSVQQTDPPQHTWLLLLSVLKNPCHRSTAPYLLFPCLTQFPYIAFSLLTVCCLPRAMALCLFTV